MSSHPHNSLEIQVSLLQHQLQNLELSMKELREDNKELIEFMYKVEGGKAWLFTLLTVAAAVGGTFVSFMGYIFPHK